MVACRSSTPTMEARLRPLIGLAKSERKRNFTTTLPSMTLPGDLTSAEPHGGVGQFKRLTGVFKSAFRKAVGNGTLTWSELSDIVLDVEIAINGRPLSYLEDDVEMPILTPSSMLHLQPTQLPGLSPHHLQETDLRKRAKYLLWCKKAMWSRWSKEYVWSLRERHRRSGGDQTPHPSVEDVVIIQDESRN